MTDEEFISLLDERGSNIAGWPAHLREDARASLAYSPQARAALKAMQDVESLLAHTPALAFDPASLASRATRENQPRRHALGPLVRKVSFAALGTMALAAGILVGMTPPSGTAIIGSVRMALNGGGSDVQ